MGLKVSHFRINQNKISRTVGKEKKDLSATLKILVSYVT